MLVVQVSMEKTRQIQQLSSVHLLGDRQVSSPVVRFTVPKVFGYFDLTPQLKIRLRKLSRKD